MGGLFGILQIAAEEDHAAGVVRLEQVAQFLGGLGPMEPEHEELADLLPQRHVRFPLARLPMAFRPLARLKRNWINRRVPTPVAPFGM